MNLILLSGRTGWGTLMKISLHILCLATVGGSLAAASPDMASNSLGMQFRLISPGTFAMGSPAEEVGSTEDETVHQVSISKPFYLGVHLVTQDQYVRVIGRNPSRFQGRVLHKSDSGLHPVDSVSWTDAVGYCQRLSSLAEELREHRAYRLPTEAEWEYACRAGTTGPYSCGTSVDPLRVHAWYAANAGEQTHPIGAKLPNPWGLHDMHGLLWQWCADWYAPFDASAQVDPSGPNRGTDRVLRGGSWDDDAISCRSANRYRGQPSYAGSNIGFRVVMYSESLN